VCVSSENGVKICMAVHCTCEEDKSAFVTLDFSGVEVIAPPFLNSAIGCLYDGTTNPRDIEANVRYVGLSQDNLELVDLIARTHIRFNNATPEVQQSITDATAGTLISCD
jgi:hypothetical protein